MRDRSRIGARRLSEHFSSSDPRGKEHPDDLRVDTWIQGPMSAAVAGIGASPARRRSARAVTHSQGQNAQVDTGRRNCILSIAFVTCRNCVANRSRVFARDSSRLLIRKVAVLSPSDGS